MRPIPDALSRSGKRRIEAFLADAAVLAFDFDGTLAPIRRDPRRVELSERTRVALTRLAMRTPCVVLSGRTRADVQRRLRGVPLAGIAGDHGQDGRAPSAAARALLLGFQRRLEPLIRELRGTRIERKHHTLAVHWRAAASKSVASERILAEVARLAPPRMLIGKCVVELHASAARHKGTALERLCRSHRRSNAIYVGDDTTDEDVFTRSGRVRVLGIHVGDGATAADLRLRRQSEVVELLEFLVDRSSTA
ncbi:MAG: trehalose-phosphatase [Planctomycetes bacterium]|nr:trehalose-phosphatase [Planctomycetota bacterium]